ncbi:hypothetical protein KFZ70_15630 [Tamlana fucoidanivorans]|uniref:DUF4625 domain-containing protein n=1 Tax=Allotamlana fucoidanivorans TaxID=2583814 RepID=A0A5C4SCD2_9FLAO|nr:hypothetical protein [Tamlana fucoidanivorans]TNJ41217.1 hypothetical protein FGF67_16385 [Tamlana fucoidanivorans]
MKTFKYLAIIVVTLMVTATSCSDDDDTHAFHLEKGIVLTAEVPEEFVHGNRYIITGTVALPNSCYFYYDQYEYLYDGTSRLIYPIVHVDDDVACADVFKEATFSIPVEALQKETYTFKFYQGEDAEGEAQFLILEVPVVE